jgi:pimeloyl-ACP methyl ester carboxylesterase
VPTVQTNDVATYYEARGDGPPVVFVHGAILDHSQWDAQVAALQGAYATFAYDVRGHGRTGGTDRRAYAIDLFAADLDDFLDALGLEDVVVCGHSMGGCIAQTYAARDPGRLSGLVLADTFAPRVLSRSEWIQRSLLLRATVPPVRLVGYERVERALVWLHERLSPGASGDYGAVRALRADGPGMATDEFAKVVRAVARFHETDVALSAIDVPTLVLYGEDEPPFLRRQAALLGTEIPSATVRAVPDAGHASNLDDPAFFTSALSSFLTDVFD